MMAVADMQTRRWLRWRREKCAERGGGGGWCCSVGRCVCGCGAREGEEERQQQQEEGKRRRRRRRRKVLEVVCLKLESCDGQRAPLTMIKCDTLYFICRESVENRFLTRGSAESLRMKRLKSSKIISTSLLGLNIFRDPYTSQSRALLSQECPGDLNSK